MVEDVQQIQNLINNEPSALEASTSDLIETPELDSETPEVDIPEDIVLNADSLIAQSLETLETARTLSVETDSDDNNIEDEFGSIIRKHKSLQKECKSMKKRITELEAEKNKLEEQLCNEIETSDRLKREKDIKTKEVEDLRRRSNEVNSLQEQVTILDRELRNFKDENRELKKQREGRISIISKLQTDITDHQSRSRSFKEAIDVLEEKTKAQQLAQMASIQELKVKLQVDRLGMTQVELERQKELNTSQLVNNILENYKEFFYKDSPLQCAICHEVYVTSTTTNCGHTFCKDCIAIWKGKNNNCPNCRAEMTSFVTNKDMDNYITRFIDEFMPEDYKAKRVLLMHERARMFEQRMLDVNDEIDEHDEDGNTSEV